MITARTRLQTYAFWEAIAFLLNGFVFIVIGLQLPRILHAWNRRIADWRLYECGLVTRATVILVRFAWGRPRRPHLSRLFKSETTGARPNSIMAARRDPRLGRHAWRGVTRARDCIARWRCRPARPFPGRDYILFVAFSVILVHARATGVARRCRCQSGSSAYRATGSNR